MSDFESFHFAFKAILNQFVFFETETCTKQPFMIKTLRKAIRSKLRNKFNKERNVENWSEYKCQHNFYLDLLKQARKLHFSNLNMKDLAENK